MDGFVDGSVFGEVVHRRGGSGIEVVNARIGFIVDMDQHISGGVDDAAAILRVIKKGVFEWNCVPSVRFVGKGCCDITICFALPLWYQLVCLPPHRCMR
jgi:hypothetical protein